MISQLPGEASPINEGGPIAISSLAKPLWFGEVYSFNCNLTRQQWADIFAYPYEYIEFSETTKNWKKGYILEAKRNPKSQQAELKLLRANA